MCVAVKLYHEKKSIFLSSTFFFKRRIKKTKQQLRINTPLKWLKTNIFAFRIQQVDFMNNNRNILEEEEEKKLDDGKMYIVLHVFPAQISKLPQSIHIWKKNVLHYYWKPSQLVASIFLQRQHTYSHHKIFISGLRIKAYFSFTVITNFIWFTSSSFSIFFCSVSSSSTPSTHSRSKKRRNTYKMLDYWFVIAMPSELILLLVLQTTAT